MDLSKPESAAPAADALSRAVGVPPLMQRRTTVQGSLTAYYWRTPRLSTYELGESNEVILALHTGGSRTVRTRTRTGWSGWTSGPGQLHLIPVRHAAAFKPDGRLEFVTLHLGLERLDSLIGADQARAISLPFRFAFDDAFARGCMRTLCEELRHPREYGSLLVDSLTDALWLHLLRSSESRGGAAPLPGRIARAREKIEASLAEGVSLADLAAEVGMSRFYFARAFCAAVGEPPHRYLMRRRIERAQELLRNKQLSLADVALSVGYSSQSHFSTAFRSVVGRTPKQFQASPDE